MGLVGGVVVGWYGAAGNRVEWNGVEWNGVGSDRIKWEGEGMGSDGM